ncbi:MAG: (E)-4-hydroxy-3-methylbut-2-enyl-diphosphate synthase [Ignavibacteriaceae bacterium]
MEHNKYCNSLINYSRLKTREVYIGKIPLGGDNPVRIQSMTTTDTMNTIATVEQTIRMANAGCEYVRITAPSIKEAANLAEIKKELKKRGYEVPLIADIHFTPNAAELAAKIVEKVRINPGNYVDKKKFETLEYTDSEYAEELERIRTRFTPLVKICIEHGTAMRIGTNHGSLSDRIMSRYGDSPSGMVESALEFLRICRDLNYHDIVLSMKSSNTKVMVEAYRLLVYRMHMEGMNYPLHLGVTEAGGGEDGRIKSALGIGTLLEDGLGDTIRVSLTEDPEFEAPVAIAMAERYKIRNTLEKLDFSINLSEIPGFSPFDYKRRKSSALVSIGEDNVPRVIADFSDRKELTLNDLKSVGYEYHEETDKWYVSDSAPDFVFLGDAECNISLPNILRLIINAESYNPASLDAGLKIYPFYKDIESYKNRTDTGAFCNFVYLGSEDLNEENLEFLKREGQAVIVTGSGREHWMPAVRYNFFKLIQEEIRLPVIIRKDYQNIAPEDFTLHASTDIGGLLVDGFGDGVWLSSGSMAKKDLNRVVFGILQAARVRISKTEYIACPSCGRTLFDLQETTEMIRKQTEHLKGVKIAIMGCIVNGPGEMADADYGYVGSGVGKITLYRGKEIIKRNVDSENAVEELINLIKEDGNWVEEQR